MFTIKNLPLLVIWNLLAGQINLMLSWAWKMFYILRAYTVFTLSI